MQFVFELEHHLQPWNWPKSLNWIFHLSLLHSDCALSIYHWNSHCYNLLHTAFWAFTVRSIHHSSWTIVTVHHSPQAIVAVGERINSFISTVRLALTVGAFVTLLEQWCLWLLINLYSNSQESAIICDLHIAHWHLIDRNNTYTFCQYSNVSRPRHIGPSNCIARTSEFF